MTAATIVALASGRPPSAIAIVRISGPAADAAVAALIDEPLPPPRRASLRALRHPHSRELLDSALVIRFPAPRTATGEDIVELHLHGGPAVVADVLATLTALPDLRLAEAGEFTRRAFHNGRLDLAQVEGLADLVAAGTSTQRAQALALAGGALSELADGWRSRIIAVLAEAEAGLDFAEDEADVAERIAEASSATLTAMADELEALLADAGRAARIRDGLTIVVTGAPNVGKSSLVNVLAMRDAAIVTAIPGTTRDLVEVPIALDGVAAVLIDTAGLRESEDPVEQEGMRRARQRAARADLVLQVIDAANPVAAEADTADSGAPTRWIVRNKRDIDPDGAPGDDHHVSARTGVGMAGLRGALCAWAAAAVRPGEPALLANARHRDAFAEAAAAVRAASRQDETVLRTEELRRAAYALGRIAGRIDVDDVLDRIFSQFCIGK